MSEERLKRTENIAYASRRELEKMILDYEEMLFSDALYYCLRTEFKNPVLDGQDRERIYDIYQILRKARNK